MKPFEPLFKNPHLATIAGNFWRRPDVLRWSVQEVWYQTEPGVQILVHSHQPKDEPQAEIVLVHGLEGSSDSGYIRSLTCHALERGFAVHRFNMRSCGGTDALAITGYHAGQTSDLLAMLKERRKMGARPLFVVGFSLGGNMSLKLAGELADHGSELLAGVCAVSAPIDLAASVDALERPVNRLYQQRFVARLKDRIRRRHQQAPEIYTLEHLPKIRTIRQFDDLYTSQLFGFGSAANYFRTQSSNQFLEHIRVPALLIHAKDDPMVPFHSFDHPAFSKNPCLRLLAVDHGGHLGFLARKGPRFWLDSVVLDWIERNLPSANRVS